MTKDKSNDLEYECFNNLGVLLTMVSIFYYTIKLNKVYPDESTMLFFWKSSFALMSYNIFCLGLNLTKSQLMILLVRSLHVYFHIKINSKNSISRILIALRGTFYNLNGRDVFVCISEILNVLEGLLKEIPYVMGILFQTTLAIFHYFFFLW